MKKFSILLMLLLLVCAVNSVTWIARLFDSYGDGWNDGVLTVNVNGSPVLAGITLESGTGPQDYTFSVANGDGVTTDYTPGSWPYENTYQIIDHNGTVQAQQGDFGSNAPGDITTPIIVSLPQVTVAPDSWNFGTVIPTTTASKEFNISNNGSTSININNIAITGSTCFSTTGLPSYPYSLGAGLSVNFTVYFTPDAVGPYSATMSVTDDLARSVYDIALTGTGGYAVNMTEGSMTVPTGVTVNFYDSGGPAADYQNNENYTYTFNAPVDYLVRVNFNSFSTESGFDYLSIYEGATLLGTYGGAATIPQTTSTTGPLTFVFTSDTSVMYPGWDAIVTVVPAPTTPVLEYDPHSIIFGILNAGTPSDWINVVISNMGTGTLNIAASDISLVGTDPTEFEFDTSVGFPAALTLGQTVNLPVRCVPTSVGTKTAILRIVNNQARTDYDVALSGTVLGPNALNESFEGTFPPLLWNTATEPWQLFSGTGYVHTGTYSVKSGYSPGGDWWLMTPQLSVTAGSSNLYFWYRDYLSDPGWDYVDEYTYVKVSTTGNATTDFTTTLWTGDYLTFTEAWQIAAVDLSAYIGMDIYVAFHSYHTGGNYRIIDDVAGPDIVVPEVPPDPVTLLDPADLSTNVQIPGLVLDWDPATTGGIADYWEVYLSTETDPVADPGAFFAEAWDDSYLSIDDTGWVLADDETYFWTVIGVSLTYGAGTYPAPYRFTTAAEVPYDGIYLTGSSVVNDVNLNWTPYTADGTLNWDNGINFDSIGLTAGGTFSVAVRFESPLLIPYAGQYVTSLTMYAGDITASSYILKAWTGPDGNYTPQTEIFSQAVTPVAGWNTFTIAGIPIPATGTLFLGYETTNAAGYYPAGCDAGPAIQYYGDLIYSAAISTEWLSLSAYTGLDYNWNISGTVTPTARSYARLTNIPMEYPMPDLSRRVEFSADPRSNGQIPSPETRYLLGYNVYRNTTLLTPVPIVENYYNDLDVPEGIYDYRVEAVYTVSAPVASNLWHFEFFWADPFTLPFTEAWDTGSFGDQFWSPSGNWSVYNDNGYPAPAAMFNWSPQVTLYSLPLDSYYIVGAGHTNITVSFDLALNNFSLDTVELMTFQVWDGDSWETVDTYSNQDYTDLYVDTWGYYSYDITALAAGHDFKVRFLASGEDSYNINQWYVDNINIYELPATLNAPNVTISNADPDVLLLWDPIDGATWYGVYAATDPYGTFTYLGYIPGTYVGVYLPSTSFEFFKVTAGAGSLPRGRELPRGYRR